MPQASEFSPPWRLILTQLKKTNNLATINSTPTNILPIDSKSANVGLLILTYSLNGKIRSASQLIDGVKIDINTNNISPFPLFLITKHTQIVKIDPAGNQEIATLSDVKEGPSVNLTALYNVKTKKWTPTRLIIFVKTPLRNASPTSAKLPPEISNQKK